MLIGRGLGLLLVGVFLSYHFYSDSLTLIDGTLNGSSVSYFACMPFQIEKIKI